MKRILLFLMILAIYSSAFLEEKFSNELVGLEYQDSPFTIMVFRSADTINIYDDIKKTVMHEYRYKITYRDKITYIQINYDNKNTVEYLLLYNKYIMIWYDKVNLEPKYIFGKYNSILDDVGQISASRIQASSELVEKIKKYSASNMGNIKLEEPWVEGSPGAGIGEYIKISNVSLDALVVFSGYISFDKPWLYSQNARPKRILVICKELGYKNAFELMDTPNPQILDLGLLIKNQDIEIIIEDIYKGSKYNDLCVSSLWKRIITNKDVWK